MKTLTTWTVVALLGISFLASAGFAFGDCGGKDHKPIKKITTTESTPTKTG